MNPFVFSCIAPHGGEIIPELKGGNPARMSVTRKSLMTLGERMKNANPDVLIVLTPHGTRIHGQFSISDSERMAGTLEENGSFFSMERSVDRELAKGIAAAAASAGIPVACVNYGSAVGPASCLPLDWGVIVPLRFMPDVPIVVINPSRELSFEKHLEFGNVLREVVRATTKRVGLIASCDWAHTHDEHGPYGYDRAARELDGQVVELIKQNRLEALAGFEADFIEAAKPDGIWQTLVLAGAISKEVRHVELLSYEAPTYFGLLCASVD